MRVKKTIMENRRKWGRRKGDFIIRYLLVTSLVAHIVVGVSIVIGCSTAMDGALDIGTSGGVDTGEVSGGGSYTGNPRIEIYWDGDTSVDRAGKELLWHYDQTAATHPELAHSISAKLINGPAASDYLVWSISMTTLDSGLVRFTAGAVELYGAARQYPPHPNGYSFEAFAGTVPTYDVIIGQTEAGDPITRPERGARLWVWNTDKDGNRGTFNAYIDLRVGGLPTLQVYVTETRTVSNIGFVKSDPRGSPDNPINNPAPLPQWSVRSNHGMITEDNNGAYSGGGYSNVSLTIRGVQQGTGVYAVRTRQDGVMVDTEGPLQVDASTTWYVESGAGGQYGFRAADSISLYNCQRNMQDYYNGRLGALWPGKGTANEQHAVIRFTGHETTRSFGFVAGDDPKNIDLMNDPSVGTVRIGQVIVRDGKILTLEGLDIGGLVVQQSKATMKQPRTVMSGGIALDGSAGVKGEFTMENGTVNNSSTLVGNNGRFTMDGGTFNSSNTVVNKGGVLLINAGMISADSKIDVLPGGRLEIKEGVVLDYANASHHLRIYNNGVEIPWAAYFDSLPYILAPSP